MQGNAGFEVVEECYHAMCAEAAMRYKEIGQLMAEQYPRPIKMRLVVQPEELRELRSVTRMGKMSPAGMVIVNWFDRSIVWCNEVFAKYFNAMHASSRTEEEISGVRMTECIPGFEGSPIEAIYETVARTQEAFRADGYALSIPGLGTSYWDWSLTPLPCASSGVPLLLVQMHQAAAPAFLAAA